MQYFVRIALDPRKTRLDALPVCLKAPESLLSNWRWKLTLWREGDCETFDATMKEARRKQLALEQAEKARADAAKVKADGEPVAP